MPTDAARYGVCTSPNGGRPADCCEVRLLALSVPRICCVSVSVSIACLPACLDVSFLHLPSSLVSGRRVPPTHHRRCGSGTGCCRLLRKCVLLRLSEAQEGRCVTRAGDRSRDGKTGPEQDQSGRMERVHRPRIRKDLLPKPHHACHPVGAPVLRLVDVTVDATNELSTVEREKMVGVRGSSMAGVRGVPGASSALSRRSASRTGYWPRQRRGSAEPARRGCRRRLRRVTPTTTDLHGWTQRLILPLAPKPPRRTRRLNRKIAQNRPRWTWRLNRKIAQNRLDGPGAGPRNSLGGPGA